MGNNNSKKKCHKNYRRIANSKFYSMDNLMEIKLEPSMSEIQRRKRSSSEPNLLDVDTDVRRNHFCHSRSEENILNHLDDQRFQPNLTKLPYESTQSLLLPQGPQTFRPQDHYGLNDIYGNRVHPKMRNYKKHKSPITKLDQRNSNKFQQEKYMPQLQSQSKSHQGTRRLVPSRQQYAQTTDSEITNQADAAWCQEETQPLEKYSDTTLSSASAESYRDQYHQQSPQPHAEHYGNPVPEWPTCNRFVGDKTRKELHHIKYLTSQPDLARTTSSTNDTGQSGHKSGFKSHSYDDLLQIQEELIAEHRRRRLNSMGDDLDQNIRPSNAMFSTANHYPSWSTQTRVRRDPARYKYPYPVDKGTIQPQPQTTRGTDVSYNRSDIVHSNAREVLQPLQHHQIETYRYDPTINSRPVNTQQYHIQHQENQTQRSHGSRQGRNKTNDQGYFKETIYPHHTNERPDQMIHRDETSPPKLINRNRGENNKYFDQISVGTKEDHQIGNRHPSREYRHHQDHHFPMEYHAHCNRNSISKECQRFPERESSGERHHSRNFYKRESIHDPRITASSDREVLVNQHTHGLEGGGHHVTDVNIPLNVSNSQHQQAQLTKDYLDYPTKLFHGQGQLQQNLPHHTTSQKVSHAPDTLNTNIKYEYHDAPDANKQNKRPIETDAEQSRSKVSVNGYDQSVKSGYTQQKYLSVAQGHVDSPHRYKASYDRQRVSGSYGLEKATSVNHPLSNKQPEMYSQSQLTVNSPQQQSTQARSPPPQNIPVSHHPLSVSPANQMSVQTLPKQRYHSDGTPCSSPSTDRPTPMLSLSVPDLTTNHTLESQSDHHPNHMDDVFQKGLRDTAQKYEFGLPHDPLYLDPMFWGSSIHQNMPPANPNLSQVTQPGSSIHTGIPPANPSIPLITQPGPDQPSNSGHYLIFSLNGPPIYVTEIPQYHQFDDQRRPTLPHQQNIMIHNHNVYHGHETPSTNSMGPTQPVGQHQQLQVFL